MRQGTLLAAIALLFAFSVAGCSHVQVLRLTSETFPPREVEDVAILSERPNVPYQKIAELSETSSSDDLDKLQEHLLDKAAQLGADAVVFGTPITRTEQRVAYEPSYSPWGYYAPHYYGPGPYGYWGPWGYRYSPWGLGWGYRRTVPVSYLVHVTTVKGTAIRYS
ncbi:hypothetical protein W02_35930 [Nitrospira sp. KM1]|uniref:hypothetical protein n=1 Tax=Nitrospira sp. KM1 TaxID=1936990 RepID=UPI0013A745EB|nr:hypothetical protein [Nitrospira sp. KM1]BCA56453.1 hypothetical protein W02_35930 [Nitrospira sp. KM1]